MSTTSQENTAVQLFEYLPSADHSGPLELACMAEQLMDGEIVFSAKSVATTVVVTPPQPLPPKMVTIFY